MPVFPHDKAPNAGFTLVEMAIVVLLVGIMVTLGVGALQAQLTNSAVTVTKERQEIIRTALVAYLRQYWRLPCPDSTAAAVPAPNVKFDGVEDRVTTAAGPPLVPNASTACVSNYGTVPYVTLGLSREIALDGWSGFFTYQVANAGATDWTRTASFDPAMAGNINLTTGTNGGNTPVASNAVAVVVSHGKNQLGAWTTKGPQNALPAAGTDELVNVRPPASLTFVKRDYLDNSAAAGGAFDDVAMFLLPEDLLTPLRSDGTLKVESDKLDAAQNVVVTNAFATCILPAAPALAGYQAYGSSITYVKNYAPAMSIAATPGATTMFTLTTGAIAHPILFSKISPVLSAYAKCP